MDIFSLESRVICVTGGYGHLGADTLQVNAVSPGPFPSLAPDCVTGRSRVVDGGWTTDRFPGLPFGTREATQP